VKLKSPGKRAVRGLAVTGMALASVTGIVMSQTPAFADPSITYAVVGSDTTQKVMDAFTVDEAGNLISSFDAANPTSTTTNQILGQVVSYQKTGTGITGPATTTGNLITANYANPVYCSFTRPNGSGAGNTAMRQAMGSTNSALVTQAGEQITMTGTVQPVTNPPTTATVQGNIPNNAPQSSCIDVGRSSSGPGAAASTSGYMQYIPFAIDSVAASVGSNGNLASLPGLGGLSEPQLVALYGSGTPATVSTGSTTENCYWALGTTAGASACPASTSGLTVTDQQVDLYVPQSGSGTRNFWLGKMGISTTGSLPNWVFDHIQQGANNGQLVEEHDGTAVSTDSDGIAPFSVSQWISEQKSAFGHVNFVANAVLLPMAATAGGTPVQPYTPFTTPVPANATLNTSFPFTREVYNILQLDRVVNNNDGQFDANLASLFVGPNSALCQDAATITSYGFALLPGVANSSFNSCGQITSALQAFPPSGLTGGNNF
jgi:hypothetical protein